METIKDRAVIVGIGQTEFSKRSGRSELRLALEAITEALEDAGLAPDKVDGLIRYGLSQTGLAEAWVAANLGVKNLRYWGAIDFGGSASCALVGHAAHAVITGAADYVVCYRALNGNSERRPGTSDTYQLLKGQDPNYDNFLVPQGFTAPVQMFSLLAARHMHEFGTTYEQLAQIAITTRANANRNPNAQMYGRPMTMEDYMAAPMVASPLRRFDCCLQTDGASAIVVTTPERARDLRQKPIYIKAAAQGTLPDAQGPLYSLLARQDILETSGSAVAQDVYRQAGMGPGDIDVAQLYDCFTPTVLLQLEAYGFCKKGESGPFVADGNIEPGGRLPINTAGGNLSEGYIHGVNHIPEAVRQLRGTSTTQIDGAQTCLITAGLPVPTSALILGGARG